MINLLLFGLGFIPFLIGSLLNWKMMEESNIIPPLFAIGSFALLIWFIISYLSFNPAKSVKEVMLFKFACNPGANTCRIQELIPHAYWMNCGKQK